MPATNIKRLGQHWLEDHASLQAMIQAATVQVDDTVLEIGPGLGSLTQLLIDAGANVVAVELDTSLATQLRSRLSNPHDQLTVINQDIMHFNLGELKKGYKVVANIPYYLTSGLIRLLSEADDPPVKAVLLVQKEVAARVAARPGQMSILSVTTQMYFETTLAIVVSAKLFIPPPKVDSQILILTRYHRPLFGDQDPRQLFKLVKAGFSERRKKLRSSLSGGLQISNEQADKLLNRAGISSSLRAQNLSLDDWLSLLKIWQQF